MNTNPQIEYINCEIEKLDISNSDNANCINKDLKLINEECYNKLIQEIKLDFKSEDGIKNVCGINFLLFKDYEYNDENNNEYYDFLISPSSSNVKSNIDNGLEYFQVFIKHLQKDDFFNLIKEYKLLYGDQETIFLNDFYNFLSNEKNIEYDVLSYTNGNHI
jgi:hypothetical protein